MDENFPPEMAFVWFGPGAALQHFRNPAASKKRKRGQFSPVDIAAF